MYYRQFEIKLTKNRYLPGTTPILRYYAFDTLPLPGGATSCLQKLKDSDHFPSEFTRGATRLIIIGHGVQLQGDVQPSTIREKAESVLKTLGTGMFGVKRSFNLNDFANPPRLISFLGRATYTLSGPSAVTARILLSTEPMGESYTNQNPTVPNHALGGDYIKRVRGKNYNYPSWAEWLRPDAEPGPSTYDLIATVNRATRSTEMRSEFHTRMESSRIRRHSMSATHADILFLKDGVTDLYTLLSFFQSKQIYYSEYFINSCSGLFSSSPDLYLSEKAQLQRRFKNPEFLSVLTGNMAMYQNLSTAVEIEMHNWDQRYGNIKYLSPDLHKERLKLQESWAYANYKYRSNLEDLSFYQQEYSKFISQEYYKALLQECTDIEMQYRTRGGPPILTELLAKPEEVYPILESIFTPSEEYPTVDCLVGIYLDLKRRVEIARVLSK